MRESELKAGDTSQDIDGLWWASSPGTDAKKSDVALIAESIKKQLIEEIKDCAEELEAKIEEMFEKELARNQSECIIET